MTAFKPQSAKESQPPSSSPLALFITFANSITANDNIITKLHFFSQVHFFAQKKLEHKLQKSLWNFFLAKQNQQS